ncbi:MAG: HIT domain-containing protein [Candidatus Omnitrophota bacterium]
MDILWAPWREKYIEQCGLKKGGCVFCQILAERKDKKHFIFLRSATSFAVLNIYPFSGAHSLVIPNRHVGDLAELTADERCDMMDLLVETKALLARVYAPEAFNVGMNLGSAAGAGIPEHLHIHIVPRWKGDVNFMPALFGTKVIPVSLDNVYKRLTDALKSGHRKVRK